MILKLQYICLQIPGVFVFNNDLVMVLWLAVRPMILFLCPSESTAWGFHD